MLNTCKQNLFRSARAMLSVGLWRSGHSWKTQFVEDQIHHKCSISNEDSLSSELYKLVDVVGNISLNVWSNLPWAYYF